MEKEKISFWKRFLGKGAKKEDSQKLYSNTKKTTTKIKLSLLELLEEKDLSKINITDLVKVAGIYRATFYLHYKNLNDVILSIEDDIYNCYDNIRKKIENIDIYNNLNILIETIGENVQLDKKYLKSIINTQCFTRVTLKLKELLNDALCENFVKFGHKQLHKQLTDEFMLNVSMFTGGLVFVYRDWINNANMDFKVLEQYVKKIGKLFFN